MVSVCSNFETSLLLALAMWIFFSNCRAKSREVAEILFISYRKCFVSGRGKSQCVHQSLNLIFKDRWVCGGNLRRVAAVAFALCVEQNVGLAVSHNIFRHFFNGRIVEMHPNAVVMSVAGVMTVWSPRSMMDDDSGQIINAARIWASSLWPTV